MRNPFAKAGNAIIWQTIQQGGVKLIFLVRLVVLARLLSPDDFGLLAISTVLIDILVRVTNFGMIPALVQRLEISENHYHAAWTVGLLRALTIAGVTFVAAPIAAQSFGEPRAANIIRLLALRPLMEALGSIKVAELTRNLDFRALAFLQVPKALSNTIIAIVLASPLGVWSLVAGTLAGELTYLAFSYLKAPYRPKLTFDFQAAQALIQFGRWVFLTSLVVLAGQSVLRVVISRQLGAADLGLYFLAASLAFLPVEVASQIVGEVAFPFYARLQKDWDQATRAFQTILVSLAVLLIPTLVLMITLTPSMIESLLGDRWLGTAPLIRILALANLIGLLGEIILPILTGKGRPDKVLVIEVIQSSILISLVGLLAGQYGVVGAATAWLPALAVSQIVSVFFVRRILSNPFAGLGRPFAILALVTGVAVAGAWSIDNALNGLVGFLAAATVGACLSFIPLWLLEKKFSLGFSDGIVQAFPGLAARLGFSTGEEAHSGRMG